MLEQPELLERLRENTATFRAFLVDAGYSPLDGEAAIIPVIVGETANAIALSERLLDEGVFVTGFGFPVVPEGTARIRIQMSAGLEPEHLERAMDAFRRVRVDHRLLAATSRGTVPLAEGVARAQDFRRGTTGEQRHRDE